MSRKSQKLAKLTKPRLYKATARERLFKLLDAQREHPVVWIVGPPGAGKTTLAASYLEEAGLPGIWYQIDPGDSDPATFFYYLKQAMEGVSRKKIRPLPLLTPEYLPDLPGFARRFLRDGFARQPDDTVLVFDNYHDIAADSTLHAAFKASLAEVPQGSNVIILSRVGPPPAFADAVLNQTIALVSWDDLRLTAEETVELASHQGVSDPTVLRTLHEQSTGWIAGVTLMLERLRRGGNLETLQHPEALDTVFDYFAGLIFDHASPETREVLMKTAFLPRVSASLAAAVTGLPYAIAHLEDLHRRHLFTDRNIGNETTYQYHALFRSFLTNQARIQYASDGCRTIACNAAIALKNTDQTDAAFVLFVEAEEWKQAEEILIATAPQLLAQGRWQTLSQWIDTLPQVRLDTNPWLRYWRGRATTAFDPGAARPGLEIAYDDFEKRHDAVGQLLCATTILEGLYFEFVDMRRMDPWIARVADLLQRGVWPPSKEDELRANSALLMGAALRAPRHAMLESCLHRVHQLLNEPFDANIKVTAACMLHEYSVMSMEDEEIRRAIQIARPLLNSPHLSAPRASKYYQIEAYTHLLHGRYAQAIASYDAAEEVARTSGFDGNSLLILCERGHCERRAGQLDRAEDTIRRIESRSSASFKELRGAFAALTAGVAFDRGDIPRAIKGVLDAYRFHDDDGDFHATTLIGTHAANMAIAGNRFDLAADMFGRLHSVQYGPIAANYLGAIVMNEAWQAHRTNDIASRDNLLRKAMRLARDERTRVRLLWYTNALSELLPIAFSNGIEAEVARSLALEFAVTPVPSDVEEWPWHVKVYTLGRFELLIDGEAPTYSRKVPKKVLSLLKAIIALGTKNVPEQRLLDALWPDEEGDAARRSLGAAVHRLRKLLSSDSAIRQAGGAVSLDQMSCWVDVSAFESRLQRGGSESAKEDEAALALYRGSFLVNEDAPWALPLRERIRAKFIQAVDTFGSSYERSGQYDGAIHLYLRGIEADHLVEPFYQGLMRCYDRLNRRTEAVSTYRRLRETLSITLGVPPSSASQRLFETLRLN